MAMVTMATPIGLFSSSMTTKLACVSRFWLEFVAFRPVDEDLAGAAGEGLEIFLLVALPEVGGDGALPDIQPMRVRDEKFENRALRGVLIFPQVLRHGFVEQQLDHLQVVLIDFRPVGLIEYPHIHFADIAEFRVLLGNGLQHQWRFHNWSDSLLDIVVHEGNVGRLSVDGRQRQQKGPPARQSQPLLYAPIEPSCFPIPVLFAARLRRNPTRFASVDFMSKR